MEPLSIGMLISGIVSAIASVVGGVTQAVQTKKTNEQNLALQHEAWDKQSIASHVQELEESGLNKQLATGYSPNYGVTAQMKTPDYSEAFSAPGKLMDMFKGLSSMKLAKAQTDNATKQNEILASQKDLLDKQVAAQQLRNDILEHDKNIIITRNILSTDNGAVRQINALLDFLGGKNTPLQNMPVVKDVVEKVNAVQKSVDERMQKAEERRAEKKEAKKAKKRQEYIDNAWRTTDSNVGAINYSHGGK